jgi:hypothetical protein
VINSAEITARSMPPELYANFTPGPWLAVASLRRYRRLQDRSSKDFSDAQSPDGSFKTKNIGNFERRHRLVHSSDHLADCAVRAVPAAMGLSMVAATGDLVWLGLLAGLFVLTLAWVWLCGDEGGR